LSNNIAINDYIIQLLDKMDSANLSENITQIMQAIAELSVADIVLLFIVSDDKFINFKQCYINTPNKYISDMAISSIFPSTFLPHVNKKKLNHPHELCAINQEIFNSSSLYTEKHIDTTYHKKLDEKLEISTVSLLSFPIYNNKGHTIGVIQVINPRNNAKKIINFTNKTIADLTSLSKLLALQIELDIQNNSYNRLLESFIEVIAKAIDNKSPYTGEHCQKVPIITRMIATAAIDSTSGPFKNFEMSNDEWYSLHIASLLHDCGKITTPDYIVDKSTKLEVPYNRIHEIRNRFEILRRDAHIEYLQKRLKKIDTTENLQAEFVNKVKKLTDDFAFIGMCNTGDTPLTKDDLHRLDEIGKQTFTRYFSREIGLSWKEKNLLSNTNKTQSPETEHLLSDRPEQVAAIYNQGELHNLKIETGTINDEERKKINEHISTTIEMLKDLSFPKELSNIIEYAGSHHERIDGKGYPNNLTGDEMSIPAKIMAIADIYEALTAKDRPYKKPKKLSQVLAIMRDMKNSGHIDPDIYTLFIKSGVYMDYAKEYISKDQIDDINIEEYL
jgi:HD-GYP domain-containing protein (c-di-GMP phosphodiesterase class II)